MLGLQEPNSWDKVTERHILFLLLIKYRLIDRKHIPGEFLDQNSVNFWDKWCTQLAYNKSECRLIRKDELSEEELKELEKKDTEHANVGKKCDQLVKHDNHFLTENYASEVKSCLEEANGELEKDNLPAIPSFHDAHDPFR